jgi:hypothetical protein
MGGRACCRRGAPRRERTRRHLVPCSLVTPADTAVIVATLRAVGSLVPQAVRLLRTRDVMGVSWVWTALGTVTNLAWFAYALARALWAGVPATLATASFYGFLFVTLVRFGALARPAVLGGTAWSVLLTGVTVIGGWSALGRRARRVLRGPGSPEFVDGVEYLCPYRHTPTPRGSCSLSRSSLVGLLRRGGAGLGDQGVHPHRDRVVVAHAPALDDDEIPPTARHRRRRVNRAAPAAPAGDRHLQHRRRTHCRRHRDRPTTETLRAV